MSAQLLLREQQRKQIFEAIEKAELDQREFDLTDDGSIVGLMHRLSGSRFVFHRDSTWRYVGYCSVSNGHEWLIDKSWMALVSYVSAWLAELKRHLRPQKG